jgi:hypothetical protein
MTAIGEEACEGRGLPPEVVLFRRVILLAVLDAIYGGSSTNERDVKARAWSWFVEAGSDFREVCEYADWNPQTVRRKALDYIILQRNSAIGSVRPALGRSATAKRQVPERLAA